MMFSVRGGSCWGEGLLPDCVGTMVVSLSERADQAERSQLPHLVFLGTSNKQNKANLRRQDCHGRLLAPGVLCPYKER